jgi:hypothetical protein
VPPNELLGRHCLAWRNTVLPDTFCPVLPSPAAQRISAIIRPGGLASALASTAARSLFVVQRGCYGRVIAADLLLRSFLHSLLPLAFLCPQ